MKTAIVTLYVIAFIQFLGTIAGFAISFDVLKSAFNEAGKSIIEISDQRYVRKQ
ncbi:hypothetical protein [Prosthecobacter sp.]|uniref:hypothetical protein n=1 Tax=Prosthecobacter sp. TaxID=1965333 RepID=UPI003783E10B